MAQPQPRYRLTCNGCGFTALTRHQSPAMRHKCPKCLSPNLKIEQR